MKRTIAKNALTLSALLLPMGMARGAAPHASLDVTADVGIACSVSATPIDFGTVDSFGGAVTTGTITVNCSSGIPLLIALDAGQHFDGFRRNMMAPSAELLTYELSSPLVGAWGDGDFTYPAPYLKDWISTGTDIFTVYADIPLYAVPISDGYYSDIVKVSVVY